MNRPVLFLDLDDVLCLNQPYGGYDVLIAFRDAARKSMELDVHHELWSELFDSSAMRHLHQIHEEFSPQYVLSTSWRWFFDREMFVETFEMAGLDFVSKALHDDWFTPQISRDAQRAVEIRRWISNHPECSNKWVALDDELSGTGFSTWPWPRQKFVVLCQEGVGLQDLEYRRLRDELTHRIGSHTRS